MNHTGTETTSQKLEMKSSMILALEQQNSVENEELELEESALSDPNLTQQIIRSRNDGLEIIVGYFRLEFSAGQKRQILHVPFVPSLRTIPNIEAHATDHQDVRIRITDTQRFGIRAEVILDTIPESTQSRLIEMIATEVLDRD